MLYLDEVLFRLVCYAVKEGGVVVSQQAFPEGVVLLGQPQFILRDLALVLHHLPGVVEGGRGLLVDGDVTANVGVEGDRPPGLLHLPEVAVEVAGLHAGQGHTGTIEEPVGGQGVLEHVDLARPLESTGMFRLQILEDFCVVVGDLV